MILNWWWACSAGFWHRPCILCSWSYVIFACWKQAIWYMVRIYGAMFGPSTISSMHSLQTLKCWWKQLCLFLIHRNHIHGRAFCNLDNYLSSSHSSLSLRVSHLFLSSFALLPLYILWYRQRAYSDLTMIFQFYPTGLLWSLIGKYPTSLLRISKFVPKMKSPSIRFYYNVPFNFLIRYTIPIALETNLCRVQSQKSYDFSFTAWGLLWFTTCTYIRAGN